MRWSTVLDLHRLFKAQEGESIAKYVRHVSNVSHLFEEDLNEHQIITVVSPVDQNGVELLLEPNAEYPAMKALKESLVKDGIPFTAFQGTDIQHEYERLKNLGVEFAMEPTNMGMTIGAVLDDTCGNLILIYQVIGA